MPLLLKLLTFISIVFLAHAIYSAHEHTTFLASRPATTSQTSISFSISRLQLPADIILETLLATLALTFCIVYSAPAFQPIRWNEWAGLIERSGWVPGLQEDAAAAAAAGGDALAGKKTSGEGSGAGNPYRALEERRGFWDVRMARKAFADFVREGEIK